MGGSSSSCINTDSCYQPEKSELKFNQYEEMYSDVKIEGKKDVENARSGYTINYINNNGANNIRRNVSNTKPITKRKNFLIEVTKRNLNDDTSINTTTFQAYKLKEKNSPFTSPKKQTSIENKSSDEANKESKVIETHNQNDINTNIKDNIPNITYTQQNSNYVTNIQNNTNNITNIPNNTNTNNITNITIINYNINSNNSKIDNKEIKSLKKDNLLNSPKSNRKISYISQNKLKESLDNLLIPTNPLLEKLLEQTPPMESNNQSVDRNKFIRKFTTQRLFMTETKLEIFDKENCLNYEIDLDELNEIEDFNKNNQNDRIVFNPGTVENGFLYFGGMSEKKKTKEGFGVQLFSNGEKYEGYWLNDKYHYYGRLITEKGTILEGRFIEGKLNGKGRELCEEYIYIGDFVDSKKEGEGKMITNDYEYTGGYIDDKKNGEGEFISLVEENLFSYEGEFGDDNFNGQGMINYPNGEKYIGDFENGKEHGKGEMTFPLTQEKYVGDFEEGMRNGEGILYRKDRIVYKGSYRNNLPHGKGFVYRNGVSVEEEFEDGIVKCKDIFEN